MSPRPARLRAPWSARHRNLPIKLFLALVLGALLLLHMVMLFNATALLDLL